MHRPKIEFTTVGRSKQSETVQLQISHKYALQLQHFFSPMDSFVW